MRIITNENQKVTAISPATSETFSYTPQMTYYEMADVPVRETDILEQLQANLQTLGDLQSRMNFMMREIRYLMKV